MICDNCYNFFEQKCLIADDRGLSKDERKHLMKICGEATECQFFQKRKTIDEQIEIWSNILKDNQDNENISEICKWNVNHSKVK